MKKNMASFLESLYIAVMFLILIVLFITEIIGKTYSYLIHKWKNRNRLNPTLPSPDLTALHTYQ